MAEKWTAENIPAQHGCVAVITGANSGLGFETAKVLAARGASVVLAVRDVEKGKRASEHITALGEGRQVSVQLLDLTDLSSIRAAAEELRAAYPRIDLLINNAGVMYPPKRTTRDGFEWQFGTNHLGHFALTGLLLDKMLEVTGSRVVTVSSTGHRIRAGIDFDDLRWERRHYDRVAAYGQSKLANLMFTYELQRRLSASSAKTIAVAAHPGAARTELGRHLSAVLRAFAVFIPVQSAAMGALPTLRAATDPNVRGGQSYGPGGAFESQGYPRLVESSKQSHDEAIQHRLWAISEELTGVTFPV